jgi:hypothetical protein
VTRTATVAFGGNSYAVDASPSGRGVGLRYDPEDLAQVDDYYHAVPRCDFA